MRTKTRRMRTKTRTNIRTRTRRRTNISKTPTANHRRPLPFGTRRCGRALSPELGQAIGPWCSPGRRGNFSGPKITKNHSEFGFGGVPEGSQRGPGVVPEGSPGGPRANLTRGPVLEPPWGLSWAPPGASWGPSWALLGRPGAPLGPSWAVLGRPGGSLGPLWGAFWGAWDSKKPNCAIIRKSYVFLWKINDFGSVGPSKTASWRPPGASWAV